MPLTRRRLLFPATASGRPAASTHTGCYVLAEHHVSIGTDGNISPTALTDEFKERFRGGNLLRVSGEVWT